MAQKRIDKDDEPATDLQDRLQYTADGNWDSLLNGLPYLGWCAEQEPHPKKKPGAEPRK